MSAVNVHDSSASRYDGDNDEGARRCRACASTALHVDWAAGDRVCTHCGFVDEERLMEQGAEWREFDDDNDVVRNAMSGGAGAAARCGLVPTNEEKWIGGLQPTSLSKHIFGGPTKGSIATRKKLVQANKRLDFLMEKKHAADVKHAKLSRQVRQQKRKRLGEDEDEEEDNHCSDNVRPELEHMLVQEEETALATSGALYADKWSLDRAIRLFGQGHEISSLPSSNNATSDDVEELRRSLDDSLLTAAQDLYRAKAWLDECVQRLQLPDRVAQEATTTLVKYAARRDGLSVRGVSSQLKQKKKGSKNEDKAEKQAREALREFNNLRQLGSLVAALLFYTSRNLSVPRSLVQVCASVETPPAIMQNPHLDFPKNEEFVKKKHCSKAMNEIKQVFPDLARASPASAAVSASPSGLLEESSLLSASVESVVEHIVRKLQLPPVAEASVKTLLIAQEEQAKDALDTQKRFIRCAALTYFVCHVGEIMQNLAQQQHDASNFSLTTKTRKKRRKVGSGKDKKPPASSDAVVMIEGVKTDANPSTPLPDKLIQLVSGSEEESSAQGKLSVDDVMLESPQVIVSAEIDQDIFDDEELAREEHRAYEMRRVWDAWREQTAWKRSALEIEKASGVSSSSIESFYNGTLFTSRSTLLQVLTAKSKLSIADEDEDSTPSLSQVPLASVLLPHVVATEPLIKEGIRRR